MAGTKPLTPERRRRAALCGALDEAFAAQRTLPPDCLAAIRAWQRTDRTYEAVQRLARGQELSSGDDRHAAQAIRKHIDRALRDGQIPFRLTVYRGVRSLRRTIGTTSVEAAVGQTFRLRGYLATSIFREVALAEFAARDGALLEIEVSPGTPAVWVAGAGPAALRRQGELLLGEGRRIEAVAARREGDIGVLSVVIAR